MTTTTAKKPKAGGEIDSYCTKCKLDLTHRIIAMVEGVVKKVECKTCGSHHLYRKPKTERDAAAAEKAAPNALPPKAPKKAPSKKAAASGAQRASQMMRDQSAAWESAIAGQPSGAFTAYRITRNFGAGELIHHSKFGDGVVARVIDRNKVEVLFQDGPKTMAQGQA